MGWAGLGDGAVVMPQKVYLDDDGNPIQAPAGKVYLDDEGNPIAPADPKVDPAVLARLQAEIQPMPSHQPPLNVRLGEGAMNEAAGYNEMGLSGFLQGITAPLMVGGAARAVMAAPTLLGRAAALVPPVAAIAGQEAADAMGVPKWLSVPAAMLLSRGRKPAARPTTGTREVAPPAKDAVLFRQNPAPASAAPASPVASPPAAPAPPAAPTPASSAPATAATSTAAPRLSPQQIRNEVGIAARRSGTKLSDQEMAQADALVAQGKSPTDAVAQVIASQAKAATSGAVAKIKLSAAEGKVYMQLRGKGKTHEEAVSAIDAQRKLAGSMGTPSSEEVRSRVAQRNVTGRWERPKADEAAKREAQRERESK